MYGPLLLVALTMAISAAISLSLCKSAATQYGLSFLLGMGVFPALPLGISWIAVNLHSATKRGVGMGIVIAVANTGGILASFAFLPKDANTAYQTGHFALAVCCSGSFIIALGMTLYFRFRNIQRPSIGHDLSRYSDLDLNHRDEEDLKGDRAMVGKFELLVGVSSLNHLQTFRYTM